MGKILPYSFSKIRQEQEERLGGAQLRVDYEASFDCPGEQGEEEQEGGEQEDLLNDVLEDFARSREEEPQTNLTRYQPSFRAQIGQDRTLKPQDSSPLKDVGVNEFEVMVDENLDQIHFGIENENQQEIHTLRKQSLKGVELELEQWLLEEEEILRRKEEEGEKEIGKLYWEEVGSLEEKDEKLGSLEKEELGSLVCEEMGSLAHEDLGSLICGELASLEEGKKEEEEEKEEMVKLEERDEDCEVRLRRRSLSSESSPSNYRLSETFCDEIFSELVKTSTFPRGIHGLLAASLGREQEQEQEQDQGLLGRKEGMECARYMLPLAAAL